MNVSVLPRPLVSEPAAHFSPQQFLGLLRRRAWLLAVCAIAGGAASYAISRTVPTYYRAEAMLSIDNARFLIPELQGAVGTPSPMDPMPLVRTEAQALSSREAITSVIESQHLADVPEFNPALRPPTLIAKFNTWLHQFMPGEAGPVVPGAADAAVFAAVEKALHVAPDKTSLIIDLGFDSEDPELAANVLNAVINRYVDTLNAKRNLADKDASTVLTQQIKDVSAEIENLQQRMKEVRTQAEFVGLRAGSVGQQQLEDLANAATQASVARAQAQANSQRADALLRQGDIGGLGNVLASTTISRLREQESSSLQRVADLTQRYGPNYPAVRAAQADVAVARQQLAQEAQRIVASLASQVTVAQAHEAETKRQLEVARQAGMQTANAQASLEQLQQEIDARRKLYQSLIQGLAASDSRPQVQNTIPELRVVSKPVPPGLPAGPHRRLAALIGIVAGGLVGVMLTVTVRPRMPAFDSVSEAARATGLPILASLPRLAGRGSLAAGVIAEPRGEIAEELRAMRMRLRSLGRGKAIRSVAFTSAGRREDATAIAAAFSRLAAADGERVLLVEGDQQKPWIADMLGPSGLGAGGTALLPLAGDGGGDWRDRLCRDPKVPLDLLLARQGAQSLTTGNMFHNLLVEAAEDYTLIVLDSPPAGNPGSAVVSAQADATVVVIDAAATERASVSETVSRLAGGNPSTLAAVLIGIG